MIRDAPGRPHRASPVKHACFGGSEFGVQSPDHRLCNALQLCSLGDLAGLESKLVRQAIQDASPGEELPVLGGSCGFGHRMPGRVGDRRQVAEPSPGFE